MEDAEGVLRYNCNTCLSCDRFDPSELSQTCVCGHKPTVHAKQEVQRVINFYDKNKEFYEFTNFHDSPIVLDGRRWPTTEHYFQAHKFTGKVMHIPDEIERQVTPRDAFTRARELNDYKRKDWEAVKEAVMERALYAKFTQHENLKARLLGTGNAKLVEHTRNDSYWGDGGDSTGQNRLGHLLEVTRARIAGEESSLEDAKVTREREEALCRERAALIRECEEHKAKLRAAEGRLAQVNKDIENERTRRRPMDTE